MVTDSVVFGLIAALMWGFAVLVTVDASRKTGNFQVLFWANFASVVMAAIYLVAASSLSQVSLEQWGVLIVVSVLGVGGYFVYYNALREGPVSVVSPIFSGHSAIAILMAVSLAGERLTAGQSLGVTAAIGGILLSSVDLRRLNTGQGMIGRGAIWAIIAVMLIGPFIYGFGRLSQEIGWFPPIFLWRLLTLCLLVPVPLVRRQLPWRGLTPRLMAALLLIGILETVGLFAFSRGAEIGLISIVTAASATYPMVPILGGVLIYRERLAPNQTIGVISVLGGLLLLSVA